MSEHTQAERAEQLHDEAFELYRQGELDSALATVERALIEDLTWSTSHATHALILAARGDDREAQRAAHAALRIEPNYAYAHFAQGVVLLEREQYEAAAQAFQSAVRYDGQSSDALVQLGLCRWQLGEKQLARRDFELAVRLDPQDHRPFQYLASLALDGDDAEGALKWIGKALEIDAEAAEVVALQAEILWEAERRDEAVAVLEAWCRAHPDQVWSRDMAARCALQMNDFDTSRAWIDEALALAPDNTDLRLLAAATSASSGAAEEAVAALETMLGEHPGNVEGLNYLAALYQDLARYDDAADAAGRALAIEAADPHARITLARCRLAQGRHDEALALVASVIETHPHHDDAHEAMAAFRTSRSPLWRLTTRPRAATLLATVTVACAMALYFASAYGGANIIASGLCTLAALVFSVWLYRDMTAS
jgi:tetratricopeptide (TPR) repeat protein